MRKCKKKIMSKYFGRDYCFSSVVVSILTGLLAGSPVFVISMIRSVPLGVSP